MHHKRAFEAMRESHEWFEILLFFKDWNHKKHSSISTEVIFIRANAEKRRGRDSTGKRQSGGLELDEGHISSHWVGNGEKSPWLLKKEEIKGRKFLQRDGGRETSLSSSSLFFFSPSFFPSVVRVVSHSAIEERCMAASRLARPLSIRI